MKIVMISRVQMNPYVRLLAAGLERAEPEVSCAFEETLDSAVLDRWRGKADVFHLHWADTLYRSWSRPRTARKLSGFLWTMARAHRAGIRLVYTAHNVRRHEDSDATIDNAADAGVFRLVDAVHVHDEEAKRELLLKRHPRRIDVIPHGNYIGAYPDTCTKQAARQRMAIGDDDVVFLALGQVRPYKGLDDLIAAFRQAPGERLRLLIAGHPYDVNYAKSLLELARPDERIHLVLSYVPDQEIQYYMRACDVCVLPYRDATTSGAAILAFSFGRPVIAPDVGPFPPLLAGGGGLLYAAEKDGLGRALAMVTSMDLERAGQAALDLAHSLDWQSIAAQHLAVYKENLPPEVTAMNG